MAQVIINSGVYCKIKAGELGKYAKEAGDNGATKRQVETILRTAEATRDSVFVFTYGII